MRLTHRDSSFLHVLTLMLCFSLQLVPQLSFAGGLGDLFPSDTADKIKSTDLKGIFRPSEKSENASDSAPSQSNSSPVVAQAESKEVTPVESPTSPAKAVEPVRTSTPPVASSPAVAKEAEEVKAWCYKKASVRAV